MTPTLDNIPCKPLLRSEGRALVEDADGNSVCMTSNYEMAEFIANAVNFWVSYHKLQSPSD